MGENWQPTEQELIETLCRVRETDWEAASDRACRPVGGIKMDGKPPGEYGPLIHEQQSYATIPREFMRSPQFWRKLPLADVMRDVFSRKGPDADAHRESLSKAIDDYRLAAKSKLVDVLCWERDFLQPGSPERLGVEERIRAIIEATELNSEHIPESPVSGGWVIEFLGDRSGCGWYVRDDEDLVKRIIACQVLKQMLSTASGAPVEQTAESVACDGAADRQLIGWIGTPGQLEKLANKLQEEKFVASAEAFAGQFDKAARKADGPYKWEDDVTLLAYLFDLLKEVSLVKKKSTTNPVVESSFLVKNLRQARLNYKANKTTLSGEPNIDKEGIPNNGNIIHQIVMRIKGKG